MRKPNFFIIGAPKCGTTSLAAWLAEHPSIYLSPMKEPHFFNRDGLCATQTQAEYDALFAQAGPQHSAIGEASTHYLYSQEAVPRILDYNPSAKFIVCVRNPIEMAPALHAERVWQGRETVKRFDEAWRLQEARRAGQHIPKTLRKDPERLQYGAYCHLGAQLQRLYTHVPRERVLVLVLDDMAANPQAEYGKVLAFLGVPDDGRSEFPVHNRRKAVRSPFVSYLLRYAAEIKKASGLKVRSGMVSGLKKLNHQAPESTAIPDALRAELVAYFRADIQLMEALLQRDFSRWLQ